MNDLTFFVVVVLGLGVCFWNDYLRAKIEHLDIEISLLKLEKKEVIADFRNYQIAVEAAAREFNGGIFKISSEKT